MTRSPFTIPLDDGPVSAAVDRTAAVVVATVAATVTVLLLRVDPDPRGLGTHEQLGMDACSWPAHYGFPCPTCGCTTAACLLLHGHPVAAFATQPFGAFLAFAGVLLGVHALRCLAQRRSFVDLLVRLPLWRIVLGMLVLLFAAWGYKCAVFEQ